MNYLFVALIQALLLFGTSRAVDVTPIQVQIVSPTNGTILGAHAQTTLLVDAVDLDGLITQVELFSDGNSFARSTESPYNFVLQGEGFSPGSHLLTAAVTDNHGNTAISEPVQIKIIPSAPVVRAVYLIPSNRTFNPGYSSAIYSALTNLQTWYSTQLASGSAFRLHSPPVEAYVTTHTTAWYTTNAGGYFNNALSDGFQLTGGTYPDHEVTWRFYLDADAKGQATGGVLGAALLHQGDLQGLVAEQSSTVKRWIGGSGHELGHAFGLPHPPSCETHVPGITCASTALMWLGYTTYPNTYLLPADKETLNQSGFFYAPTHAIILAASGIALNHFTFTASVETGWPMHVLSSSNLHSWVTMSNLVSATTNVQITAPVQGSHAFFRVQY